MIGRRIGCGAGAGEFGEMVHGHFLLSKEYYSWKKERKNIYALYFKYLVEI